MSVPPVSHTTPPANPAIRLQPVEPSILIQNAGDAHPRLAEGQPALKGLETLMSQKGVGENDIQKVKGKFLNQKGEYGTEQGSVPIQAKPFDMKFEDGKMAGKQGFCFELEWHVEVENKPPLIMRQTVYTNIEIPADNDPEVYERAKNRAKNVAMAYQHTIKAALDKNHPDHGTALLMQTKLRQNSSITVSFKGEKPYDFAKKKYLDKTYHGADESEMTVIVGDRSKEHDHVKGEFNFNRVISKIKGIAKAQKLKSLKVVTAKGKDYQLMQKIEELDQKKADDVKKALDQKEVDAKILAKHLQTKLKESQKEFEEAFEAIVPPKPSMKRTLAFGKSHFDDFEKQVQDNIIDIINFQTANEPDPEKQKTILKQYADHNPDFKHAVEVAKEQMKSLKARMEVLKELKETLDENYKKWEHVKQEPAAGHHKIEAHIKAMNKYHILESRIQAIEAALKKIEPDIATS